MRKMPSEKQPSGVKTSETLDGDVLSDFLCEAEAASNPVSAAAERHLKKGHPVFYVDDRDAERGTITKLDSKGTKDTV